jgi:hypothetical protein
VFLDESLKNAFSHLLMPVQILMYKDNNELRSIYSTSKYKTIKQLYAPVTFGHLAGIDVDTRAGQHVDTSPEFMWTL